MKQKAEKTYHKGNSFAILFESVGHAYGVHEADIVLEQAIEKLTQYLMNYRDIPKGEQRHVYGAILPQVAVYEVLSNRYGQTMAMYLIEDSYWKSADEKGAFFQKMVAIPGMKYIFLKLFSIGTKSMFSTKNGFSQEFITENHRELRFNMTACPYCKYTWECGVPELTHIFCNADDHCYGNLKHVAFERTQTLGKGGDCCDFCFKIK